MRWCTYFSTLEAESRVGLVENDTVYGLSDPASLISVISSPEAMAQARRSARDTPSEVVPLSEAPLLAPVPVPPSVRDFMAFEEHVVSSTEALGLRVDPGWYEIPVFYFSNPAAIVGPYDEVAISPGSEAFDFELEIAAVIGRPGADIQPERAESHIAGYTILCDWSARDLQEQEMKLNLGPAKGKDSATSIGPVLVTPDELEPFRNGNAYGLKMTAAVNGNPYSSGDFSAIYWSFPQLLTYASRGTELRTGDIIGSGTVGTGCILELARTHGAEVFPWLKSGDRVTVDIEHIGSMETLITSSPRNDVN